MGIILDSAGIPVTQYIGGHTYTLIITDTNTSSGPLPKYGFECSVVTGSGSSSVQAGSFGTAPANTAVHTTSSRKIWGHDAPISPAYGVGATGSVYIDSIQWTAPAAGSGTVTVYNVMNNVNNNGSADAGDLWNNISVSFTERTTSHPTSVQGADNDLAVQTYPNPVTNMLNISLGNTTAAAVQVFDLNGRCVASEQVSGSHATINTGSWAAGMYHIAVNSNGKVQVIPVVKQ